MNTTYRSKRDQQIADEFLSGGMSCRVCRSHTDIETVSSLGGQCRACFDAYCRAGSDAPPRRLTVEQKRALVRSLPELLGHSINPGRMCADRLRERAQHEPLSRPQRAQLEALEAVGK